MLLDLRSLIETPFRLPEAAAPTAGGAVGSIAWYREDYSGQDAGAKRRREEDEILGFLSGQ